MLGTLTHFSGSLYDYFHLLRNCGRRKESYKRRIVAEEVDPVLLQYYDFRWSGGITKAHFSNAQLSQQAMNEQAIVNRASSGYHRE